MQDKTEINKDSNYSGIKYGLVKKEDHIENNESELKNENINNLFEEIANTKETQTD
jgi:hypothetical protein